MEFATIGTALTSRRKALNIDQARAAAIIGMSRTTFSSYERDLQRPSAEVLPSLAEFLEISIDDILTLYGGTCIVALRPSLERFLATHDAEIKDRPPAIDGGSAAPVAPTPDPVTSSVSALESADSDGPIASAPDPGTSTTPVAPSPVKVEVPAVSLGASKDASVSIFAHELSEDPPRQPLPSDSSDPDREDHKATKSKGGKKKKGKKGKRARA